ncbi:MAG: enolase C-terminal domain-like protein [Oscillospiraceae bacterium]
MAVTIKDVRTILTAPSVCDLLVVKIETSEPGLYGLGCATFTQRILPVKTAVDEYLKPMLIGRDVSRIEDIWQQMMGSSYWRNGPVLNNAISGVDEALWDIKGKMANMPVYDLIGGKCREGVAVLPFGGGRGRTLEELGDDVEARLLKGQNYFRVGLITDNPCPDSIKPEGAVPGYYLNPKKLLSDYVAIFKYLRERFGDEPEFAIDVHERFSPTEAIQLCKALEPYHPFFLEDLLQPENVDWFENVRNATSIPMAMGELFNNPVEYKELIAKRRIDYIRCHISQLGGFTPARKLAAFCEAYAVKTIWHGPHDLTPVGAAAQIHLDLATANCAMQEIGEYDDVTKAMFPGSPEIRNGYVYCNDKPGWGVDFDEELAKKYPPKGYLLTGGLGFMARRPDGTAVRS